MRRHRHPIEELRQAIDCLPVDTRRAMLAGVRSNDIIVGAYTDRRGGVCPMLAAHRSGGRTSLLSFARAWDRFAKAGGRARRASERELRILTAHLEASLMAEHRPDLERALVEHQELIRRRSGPAAAESPDRRAGGEARASRPRRPGDRGRARELAARAGWAWLRPFRRYDDYARALERVESERDLLAAAADEPRTPAAV
jgi:hypothetical protein